jgi:hypothetical protein
MAAAEGLWPSSPTDLSEGNSIPLMHTRRRACAWHVGFAVFHDSFPRARLSGAPLFAQFLDVFNGLRKIMI